MTWLFIAIATAIGAWLAVICGRALTLQRGSATYGDSWTSRVVRIGPQRLRALDGVFALTGAAIVFIVLLVVMRSDPPGPSRGSSTPSPPAPSQSGFISTAELEQALGRRYEIQKVDSTTSDIAVIIRDLKSPQRWAITYEMWASQQAAADQFNAQEEIAAEAKLRGVTEPNFCVLPSVGPNYCSILQHKVIVGVQRVPVPEKNFGGSLRRLAFIARAALTQTQNVKQE